MEVLTNKKEEMGIYTYINQNDRIDWRDVKDLSIKAIFEEALKYDPSIMLTEMVLKEKKHWYSNYKDVTYFTVYHEQFQPNGKPAFEARQQLSATGSKEVVIAYLYGIINGALSRTITNKLK